MEDIEDIFKREKNKYNFFENIDVKTVDFVKELTNINFKNNSDICEKIKELRKIYHINPSKVQMTLFITHY